MELPAFMPVATQGTVKGLEIEQLRATGAADGAGQHLSPGAAARRGGGARRWAACTRFMGWDGPILTDSGGFQLFSLAQHQPA